jgi:hypothetical protein
VGCLMAWGLANCHPPQPSGWPLRDLRQGCLHPIGTQQLPGSKSGAGKALPREAKGTGDDLGHGAFLL